MTAKTDIVIVGYQGDSLLLFRSIRSMGGEYRVIFIDNLRSARAVSAPHLECVVMPENIGWVKGANVGLAMSTAPYVVLMNDDVEILTPGWLDILQGAFQDVPRLGCVVPTLEDKRYPKQLKAGEGVRVQNPRDYLDHVASFFCVMFSREALVDVGYLDERFSPGYADDQDWINRAWFHHGLNIAVHNDVLVKHQGSASFKNVDKGEIQRRNVEKLREKYSR